MKKSIFNLLISTIVITIITLSLPSNGIIAKAESLPLSDGKALTEKMLRVVEDGEDMAEIWSSYTESEKEYVREFIRQVEPVMKKINNQDLSDSEFNKLYNTLSEDMKLATRAFFIVDTTNIKPIKSSEGSLIQPTAEYRRTLTHPLKNVFGILLGTYYHRIVVFSDGTKITSASRYAWGESEHIGYHYNGTEYLEKQGGKGYNFFWSEVLGKFSAGIGGINLPSRTVKSDFTVDYKGRYYY
ncbi:hypothetical protein [Paucisalibacillus globulus]|uniref:hypothetical protein n=1 Tax=Paucisalibacillus globulus TaxID=351095 RepID=UPI0004218FCE|nr:hypothetical protein [Paucisalibacillus globulus]